MGSPGHRDGDEYPVRNNLVPSLNALLAVRAGTVNHFPDAMVTERNLIIRKHPGRKRECT